MEETGSCEQMMEKAKEAIDQYRLDNNDWVRTRNWLLLPT
jgi:hypothetical protein